MKVVKSGAKRAPFAVRPAVSPKTAVYLQGAVPILGAAGSAAAAAFLPELVPAVMLGSLVGYAYLDSLVPRPLYPLRKGEPAAHLGWDEYGLPLCLPLRELTRHVLLVGTTGSGKTTTIRTLAESVMKLGGGFMFVDGKADVTDTYALLYEIVKECDREEDLRVLNFLNPSQSNTFNFLLYGDSDFLSEVLSGFLPHVGGDQTYWQEKGKVLMKTLLAVLVHMRDHPEDFPDFKLTISTVRQHLGIYKLIELARNERLPLYDESGRPVKQRLLYYLDELGPWQELTQGWASSAAQEVVRQHAFYVQQWTASLDLLAGAYGKIFDTLNPDVDMIDVVTNSRVLIVLLPSLQYSPLTLTGLGRLVLSTFKVVLSNLLGRDVEGDYEEIARRVRVRRPSLPFLLVADEYGSYAVEGFDTVLAQARSLGVGVVISVQELASLFKASEVDAKRLLGNTNLKLVMKVEDMETAEYLSRRIGEEYVLMPSVRMHPDVFLPMLESDGGYAHVKEKRIDPRDLFSLRVGEGFAVVGDEVRRYRVRYLPPKGKVKALRLWRRVPQREAALKAEKLSEGVVMGVAEMMELYGLDPKADALWRKYKLACEEWLAERGIEVGAPFPRVQDLVAGGYLQVKGKEELEAYEDVLRRRKAFAEFLAELDSEMKSSSRFFEEVFKPSREALEYLRSSRGEQN
ncbi:MAG: helicase HerA-like domain-containing protein [Thermofilum sp.]